MNDSNRPSPSQTTTASAEERMFPTLTGAQITRVAAHSQCVALDEYRFIETGPSLSRDDLAAAGWRLTRAPCMLETSRPGVFAVGDVRAGSFKRVASAVGEGSMAVALVHQVLHE
jgi:thioredoxin reductase